MKNETQFIVALFAVSIFLLTSCGNKGEKQAEASSAELPVMTEVMPEVVFENEFTKVVKVSLAPGEALASHEGEARVIYSLNDYSIDWEEQGKNEGNKSWSAGDVHFHEAGQHSAKNNGDATAEWLAFVKKDTELPECGENTLENDVNSVAPEFSDQRFENEAFRVTEVTLPQGGNIPMHSGINRIICSLTDYQITYESNNEGTAEKEFKNGDVHWHEACQHALENNGETEARFLVVSYK